MSHTRTDNPRAVPSEIRRTLRRIIRRARTVILLKGLCATIAVAIFDLLVVMGIDAAMTILSPWPRRVLTGGAWLLTGLTAIVFLVRPLARSFTLTGIARAIESRHPELHERISSAIQLLASDDAPELRGSDALIGALATEATLDAKRVAPRREITLRPMRPFLIAAAAVLAILGGLLAAWPKQTSLLLARAVAPAANLPHVSAAALVIKPGRDVAIAAGEQLEVTLIVHDRTVRSAEIRVANEGDRLEETLEMAHVGTDAKGWPRFSCTLGPAARSFSYRARAANGGPTRRYRVTVVEPPAVTGLDLHFEYPPYTGRESRSELDTSGDISAVPGTVVTIDARTNVPLTTAELRVNGTTEHVVSAPPLPAEPGQGACAFRVTVAKKLTGKWTLKLARTVEGRSFESLGLVRSIQAVPDSPPTAKILAPDTTQLKLQPADVVTIRYELGDDFALGSAEMLITADGRKLPPMPLAITQPDGKTGQAIRRVLGTASLDLGAMDLRNVKFVTFQLRATDNLPATSNGPQEGFSAVCNIELQTDAPSYAVQMMLAQELMVRQRLRRVLAHVQAAHKQTTPLCKSVEAAVEARAKRVAQTVKDRTDPSLAGVEPLTKAQLEQIQAIRGELGPANGLLVDLIREIAASAYSPMVERIGDLSGRHVGKAYHLAGQIRLIETLKERHDLADETDNHVARAIEILNEMLAKLDGQGKLARKALRMEELAQHQAELAAALKSLAVDDSPATQEADTALQDPYATIDLWQEAQAAIAGQIADEAGRAPAALAMLRTRDAERSEDLAQRARGLAARQTALMKRTQELAASEAQLGQPGGDQGTPGLQPSAQESTAQKSAAERDRQARLLRQALLGHLLDQQAQLSSQVAQASDEIKDIWPQMDRLDTYASRAARDTAELLRSAKLPVAARRAAQAARKLADLANRFGAAVPRVAWLDALQEPADNRPDGDRVGSEIAVEGSTKQQPDQVAQPDSTDTSQRREELARQVGSLASRQRFLAAQMAALDAGQTGRVLCLDQGDLAVRTAELAADVELVRQHAGHLAAYEPIRMSADDAAAHLAKAQEAQHRAGEPLAGVNPGEAIASQKAAAAALTAAAEALEAMGRTLLEAAAKTKPPEDPDGGHLADAFEAAERAARETRMSQAQRAAALLSQLAKAAMVRADQMGLAMQMTLHAGSVESWTGGMVFLTDREVRKLEAIGIVMEDWARLPGELRDEVLQGASDASPEQYRALIKQYFQAVARLGSSPGAADKTDKAGDKK